MSNRQ